MPYWVGTGFRRNGGTAKGVIECLHTRVSMRITGESTPIVIADQL